MTWYVGGTLSGSVLTVQQVGDFPRAADATVALVGSASRINLQDGWTNALAAAANGTIVGGTINIASGLYTPRPDFPVTVADQKAFAAEWYREAMLAQRQQHWPYATRTDAQRSRAQRVVNVELPKWLANGYGLMIGVADGDVFPTYNTQQRNDLFVHFNALLRGGRSPQGGGTNHTGGIVETWYRAGIALDNSDSNAAGWASDVAGYSDFVSSAGVLRTPDYTWTQIPGLSTVMAASDFALPST